MEVHVINDLLWGSCSKRLFLEYYAHRWQPDAIVTNGMPNSGGYDSYGRKWSNLPIGYPCKLMVSPGSVLDLYNLEKEKGQLPFGAEVLVHENAGVVIPEALESEKKYIRIGSTMTGGAAVNKIKMDRDPDVEITAKHHLKNTISTSEWVDILQGCNRVLVLCAQGHGLSLNWGMYPFTTSRNTSPAQTIADCGIPPQAVKRIIGCCRPFPIRVSNRFDESGKMVGYSGPCYPDQSEISWGDIGVPEEITSVSKKVRRVFTFSRQQLFEAVNITGTTDVFLGFINYLKAGDDQMDFVNLIEQYCKVSWIGYDKTVNDIVPIEEYLWDKSWV